MHCMMHKCFRMLCVHRNKALTYRLQHILSSVKPEHSKLTSMPCFPLQPITKFQFTPVRTIYYLADENEKEFRRYPSALDIAEDTIKEIFLSENPTSTKEWDDTKMKIMTQCFSLTDENFDSILMQVLLQDGKLQLAQSFMAYMKERKLKPNFVTLCKYMVLCSKNVNLVGQDTILETYGKIISDLDTTVLNSKMVEFLVLGLCATDKWRKSFDYINNLPGSRLTHETVNAMACAALRHQDYRLACNIMNNWYRCGDPPSTAVFEEYIKFIMDQHRKDPDQARNYFMDMMDYAKSRGIIWKQKTVVYIEEYFKRLLRYSTSYSKVGRDGVCCNCNTKLEPCTLTKEEFSYLRNAFFKYSVKKSDVFINTTETEFERYCSFVERFKPFDIVLDGLNVAHTVKAKKLNRNLAAQLFNVVQHLSKTPMNRILVLGRSHMKVWPYGIMKSIRQKCNVFYVSNSSQDDPFLIYAALASGPDALIVSSDMMRDHISRLPDARLIQLFKKWQQSHQVYLENEESEDKVALMGPLKHNIGVQGNFRKCFHIPFDNEVKREPYEELNNWLCIQK